MNKLLWFILGGVATAVGVHHFTEEKVDKPCSTELSDVLSEDKGTESELNASETMGEKATSG